MKPTTWVKHERLDDEVMVIDLESGAYFAFVGAAADAWTLLAGGADAADAGSELATRYEVSPEKAAAEVGAFADQLAEEGLLEPGDPHQGTALPPPGRARLEWQAPTTQRFDDLQDLLLIDP
ncbi:MAG: hypothetical protein JWP82_1136, partial [Humibacillus sp.]|nr:hypothetical protein [Humibacillus sp.]